MKAVSSHIFGCMTIEHLDNDVFVFCILECVRGKSYIVSLSFVEAAKYVLWVLMRLTFHFLL